MEILWSVRCTEIMAFNLNGVLAQHVKKFETLKVVSFPIDFPTIMRDLHTKSLLSVILQVTGSSYCQLLEVTSLAGKRMGGARRASVAWHRNPVAELVVGQHLWSVPKDDGLFFDWIKNETNNAPFHLTKSFGVKKKSISHWTRCDNDCLACSRQDLWELRKR